MLIYYVCCYAIKCYNDYSISHDNGDIITCTSPDITLDMNYTNTSSSPDNDDDIDYFYLVEVWRMAMILIILR